MSKDSFSWKSLFLNEDKNDSEKKVVVIPSSLPSEEAFFPVDASDKMQTKTALNNPYIDEILDVYEKGFNSLNIEGFDFFELYKSVVAVGVTNPQSYHMAFTMGKTIKSDLTKEQLVEKSKFYLDEIEKVYQKYDATGRSKKNDLDMAITRDKVNLSKRISDLEAQILELQKELEKKKIELSKIDSTNVTQYNEIQMKIEANDFANKKIVDSINIVVAGIKQYL